MATLQPDILGSARPYDEIVVAPPDWEHPETSGPSTMEQLLADAAARFREDLVGAGFVINNETYIISDCTETRVAPEVHYKRTLLPRFRAGNNGRPWVPSFSREYVENTAPKKGDKSYVISRSDSVWHRGNSQPMEVLIGGVQTERHIIRSLDVYGENGQLARSMQLDETQLRDFINFGSTDDKFHHQIKKIFWMPEINPINPDQTIGIPIKSDRPVYDQIRKSQDQLLLHSWEGLVLELPSTTSESLRVIKDVVTSEGLSNRHYEHHRKIVVNHESGGIVTGQTEYDEKAFREFLEANRDDPKGAPKRAFRAYWEIPTELLEHPPRIAANLLGQWALGFLANVGPRAVDTFPKELRRMILAAESRKSSRKYGMKLREVMNTYGAQNLQNLATSIRSEYIQDKNRLGMAHIGSVPSIERIIWDLVKARYYYDNPDEAKANKEQEDSYQADPFGTDIMARTRQRNFIDLLIGRDIANRVLSPTTKPKPSHRVNKTGQIIIEEMPFIDVKSEVLDQLQPDAKLATQHALGTIYNKIKSNFEKRPRYREPITWAELALVGREARRSINE